MSEQRIWFIMGISRGIGKAMAETVLAAGDAVIGTARSGKDKLGSWRTEADRDAFRAN